MDILSQLDWSKSKKDWCAANVASAFGCAPLGNAYEWVKYGDHTTNPKVGDVAVFDRWNTSLNAAGLQWGHVGVITKIEGDSMMVYDGPNAYNFKVKLTAPTCFVSPEKMVKLGSKIKLNSDMGYYEEIFKKNYTQSSVYSNMEDAKARLGDVAYFIAIGLERVKNNQK